jgi:ATP-binding cassette subfamily F protein 3
VGYLQQLADASSEQSVWEVAQGVFGDLLRQQERLHELEAQMADPDLRDRAMGRYSQKLADFEMAGGYTYEVEMRRVLGGLGFGQDDWSKPLSLLSGGQRTRAQLARLLLSQPDLMLLDEPINHLDLQATEWLEEYLANWQGSLIVVAHDRYFLDRVANRVWELSFGQLEAYNGNYSQYARVHQERQARRWQEYRQQQRSIKDTEEFIRRNKAGQRAAEARGRLKRLEHQERLERPRQQRTMHWDLKSQVRGGNQVMVAHDLRVGYDRTLLECPDLLLLRGERVAILGPNGCGKTTLLKTILGEVPARSGEVRLGPSIHVAYLAQGHEDLDEGRTVLEEILEVKNLPLPQARTYLGRFLFSGDDVFKAIGSLSGGERGRVALAKMALQGANLLLLDEPTNHLDIDSQELLERVLEGFDGTILFVSHDRYFIDALATQVWAVENCRLVVVEGNYTAFQQWQRAQTIQDEVGRVAEAKPAARRIGGEDERMALRLARQREQRRAGLEEEIQHLETRLSSLTTELEQATESQRLDRLYELGHEYADVQEKLQQSLDEWVGVGGE